jgi:hypothetical protein
MDNALRDDNNNFVHNPVVYLKANNGFQHGYGKIIIKIVKLTVKENCHPRKNNQSDIRGRSYLNKELYNTNEDYIAKSLYLNTLVDKLPDDIDDRANKVDLKVDMDNFRYKSAFSFSEQDTVPTVTGGYSSLYQRCPLSDEELEVFEKADWVDKSIFSEPKDEVDSSNLSIRPTR